MNKDNKFYSHLIKITRRIVKLESELNGMNRACITLWDLEEQLDFRVHVKIKSDTLTRLQRLYDTIFNEYVIEEEKLRDI